MDDPCPTYFGDLLKRRLKEVVPEMHAIRSSLRASGESPDPMDDVDLTSSRYAREFLMLIQGRNGRAVLEISRALRRIADGTFGVCEECGDPIALERLKVQPTTQVCLDCQREAEFLTRRKIA